MKCGGGDQQTTDDQQRTTATRSSTRSATTRTTTADWRYQGCGDVDQQHDQQQHGQQQSPSTTVATGTAPQRLRIGDGRIGASDLATAANCNSTPQAPVSTGEAIRGAARSDERTTIRQMSTSVYKAARNATRWDPAVKMAKMGECQEITAHLKG